MARIVLGLMMVACGCTMVYAVWCDMAGWAAVFGMLFAGFSEQTAQAAREAIARNPRQP